MKANYSNEGGVGYNRYQKNIMGMWIVNELQKEICPDESIVKLVQDAENSDYDLTLDANDPSLMAPESMKAAFDALLPEPPKDTAGYFRCAYRSLALSYRDAISELESNTGVKYSKLYIVGEG